VHSGNGYCGHGYYQFSRLIYRHFFRRKRWILKHIYLTKFGLFGHRKWKVPAKYRQWGTYMTSTLCNLHILCIKNESNATIKCLHKEVARSFGRRKPSPAPDGTKGDCCKPHAPPRQFLYWFLFNISAGYASNPNEKTGRKVERITPIYPVDHDFLRDAMAMLSLCAAIFR